MWICTERSRANKRETREEKQNISCCCFILVVAGSAYISGSIDCNSGVCSCVRAMLSVSWVENHTRKKIVSSFTVEPRHVCCCDIFFHPFFRSSSAALGLGTVFYNIFTAQQVLALSPRTLATTEFFFSFPHQKIVAYQKLDEKVLSIFYKSKVESVSWLLCWAIWWSQKGPPHSFAHCAAAAFPVFKYFHRRRRFAQSAHIHKVELKFRFLIFFFTLLRCLALLQWPVPWIIRRLKTKK